MIYKKRDTQHNYTGKEWCNLLYDISRGWYQKGVQINFFKELIIFLKRRWLYAKDRYKSKINSDLSLSQKLDLVCR